MVNVVPSGTPVFDAFGKLPGGSADPDVAEGVVGLLVDVPPSVGGPLSSVVEPSVGVVVSPAGLVEGDADVSGVLGDVGVVGLDVSVVDPASDVLVGDSVVGDSVVGVVVLGSSESVDSVVDEVMVSGRELLVGGVTVPDVDCSVEDVVVDVVIGSLVELVTPGVDEPVVGESVIVVSVGGDPVGCDDPGWESGDRVMPNGGVQCDGEVGKR